MGRQQLVLCVLYALRIQLSLRDGNGWLHNALPGSLTEFLTHANQLPLPRLKALHVTSLQHSKDPDHQLYQRMPQTFTPVCHFKHSSVTKYQQHHHHWHLLLFFTLCQLLSFCCHPVTVFSSTVTTSDTRAVLSPGNCAKPCKFQYVKPVENLIHTEDSDQQRKVAFSTTALSFDNTSPVNPDEYQHKTYIVRNHRLWATFLPLTVYTHLRVF